MPDEKREAKTNVAKPKSRGAKDEYTSPLAWFCAGVAVIFASLSILLSYNHEWAAAAGFFPLGLIACLMFARIDQES